MLSQLSSFIYARVYHSDAVFRVTSFEANIIFFTGGSEMNYKVESLLIQARDMGVTPEELLKVVLKDNSSYVFEAIRRNVEIGRKSGADADFVYNKLMSMVTEEQLDTYIKVQEYVDDIMSEDGLEIDLIYDDYFGADIDFLKTNRELIEQELKSRGVKQVGSIINKLSGVVTLKADVFAQEMTAWSDMFDEKESQFYEYYYDSILNNLEDAIFKCITEGMVIDIEQIADEALTYKDIHKVLHSDDMSGFSKHELDIYFAYKAVIGDVIYYNDDIAAEVMRVYDYLYRDYEKILEAFERINSDYYSYNFSLDEYDSISELAHLKSEGKIEDWISYSGECSWRNSYL